MVGMYSQMFNNCLGNGRLSVALTACALPGKNTQDTPWGMDLGSLLFTIFMNGIELNALKNI